MTPTDNPAPKRNILSKWRDCLSEVARGAKTSSSGSTIIAYAVGAAGLVALVESITGVAVGNTLSKPVNVALGEMAGVLLLAAGTSYAAGSGFSAAAKALVKKSPVRTRPSFYELGKVLPLAVGLLAGVATINIVAHNVVMPEVGLMTDTSCPDDVIKAVEKTAKANNVEIICARPAPATVEIALPAPGTAAGT